MKGVTDLSLNYNDIKIWNYPYLHIDLFQAYSKNFFLWAIGFIIIIGYWKTFSSYGYSHSLWMRFEYWDCLHSFWGYWIIYWLEGICLTWRCHDIRVLYTFLLIWCPGYVWSPTHSHQFELFAIKLVYVYWVLLTNIVATKAFWHCYW